MSILTKPAVQKGVAATFSISKTELLAHPLVSADSYFSDSGNWYRINVVYKSLVGSQYEIVEFDASLATPTGTFLVSPKARDQFQVQKVQITDFDGGFLEIFRADLTVSEWDVTIASAIPIFTRDYSNPSNPTASETLTGSGLGNNISNNLLNLFVPDSSYNSSLYYFVSPIPFTMQQNKTYKIKFTLSGAPSVNANLEVVWNNGNNSLFRQLTAQEISQGYFEVTGVIPSMSFFSLKCRTVSPSDTESAYIRISKYEVFEE